MNREFPTVSVVIAARPGQAKIQALAATRALDYPVDRIEILVARGTQPSAQRNAAIRQARGDLIYFLDDDSMPGSGNLTHGTTEFEATSVKMLGGPNLCPPQAPALEQIFATVLSCWLAFGPSRARYSRVGQMRDSSEKELILCNLLARREVLLELGGFDESLYPNEENALMDRIQSRGGRLLYSPDFYVYRRPRPTFKAFCRMLMTYGRGRAEQFRRHPTLGSVLNFAPPLFCVFLVALPWLGMLGKVIIGTYLGAVLLQMLAILPVVGLVKGAAVIPMIILTHILYGVGFWRGLFTRFERRNGGGPIVIERV